MQHFSLASVWVCIALSSDPYIKFVVNLNFSINVNQFCFVLI